MVLRGETRQGVVFGLSVECRPVNKDTEDTCHNEGDQGGEQEALRERGEIGKAVAALGEGRDREGKRNDGPGRCDQGDTALFEGGLAIALLLQLGVDEFGVYGTATELNPSGMMATQEPPLRLLLRDAASRDRHRR
jgi:hypothetical protein